MGNRSRPESGPFEAGGSGAPSPRPGNTWVSGACDLVAALPNAALLIDPDGRVAATNTAAQRVMDGSPLFIDVFGRLRTRIPALQRRLANLLKARGDGPRMLRVVDYGAAGDIVLTVSHIEPRPAVEGGETARPLTLVCLACEATWTRALRKALGDLYGLSRDEAAAAIAIHHGQRTTDFATAHGLDVLTAYALREAVMERLGAHRSADVARRVAIVGQMVPLGGPLVGAD